MDHERTGLAGATETPGRASREGAVGQMGTLPQPGFERRKT